MKEPMNERSRDAVPGILVEGGTESGDVCHRRSTIRRLGEAFFISNFFALVLLSAIPLGANRDWAWSPIAVILGVLAVWHALGLGIDDGHRVRAAERRPLIALVLCFLVVIGAGALQLSPATPQSWHAELYAPAAAALHIPLRATATLDSETSSAILMKIATCGIIFEFARSVGRDRRRVRLFLSLFLAVAAIVTTYGLYIQANGSCNVLGYVKGSVRNPYELRMCLLSGTFVSSNSYATYAGMALVVAVGLAFGRAPAGLATPSDFTRPSPREAWLTGTRVVCLATMLFLMGGMFLSASRAGFVATVIAVMLLGFLLLRGRWPSRPALGWALAAAIPIGAALALFVGSIFFHRMSALSDDDLLSRFRIWQLALAAVQQSPWIGWGLGSFADVYSLLQPPDLQVPNDKAHSTPLEWIVDLGIPAAIFAFGMVLIPLGVCLRGYWRRRRDRYLPAVAFAACVVAILHSTVDFSLQIPAIGFMMSALLGLGWAQAFRRHE